MIRREDWDAWLEMPQTRALRAMVRIRREELKTKWEQSGFVTEQQNWEAIGACKALLMLEDLEFESVETSLGELDGE